MTDVIGHDDAEAVIGLTNQELMDQFGVSLGGSLLPDTAVAEEYVTGGCLLRSTVLRHPRQHGWT